MFAQYTPGTYKGSAYGRSDKEHNGLVEVEVTVSADKIDDIKVVTYNQSVDHKKYGTPVNEAKTKNPAQILEKQKLDADVVTDATMATTAIELAVAKALQQAVAKKYTPGTYKGSAMGRKIKNMMVKLKLK
ncbi:MAG: FMN-binding protein [Ignavibacteriales bacterium]|nr:FMN-binding protein [Ignavibacteriales bacterium]